MAHGLYEGFLNGERIGDAELTPGFTQYRTRLQVQTYDVTENVRPGRNAIGVIVADGWYRGLIGYFRAADQWPDGTVANISPAAPGEALTADVAHLNGSEDLRVGPPGLEVTQEVQVRGLERHRACGPPAQVAVTWPR